ncbi:MAG: Gfo/Idh/MocA family protein [Jiangellaceae bacterium]
MNASTSGSSSLPPIRWGIVATGGIAHTLAGEMLLVEDARIVAVSSRVKERAQVFAGEFGIPRAYGSYADLLADDDVDVVYVATPHAQHAEIVDAALDARKAVLCEKAFTTSLAETERLAQKARDLGVFCMEAMWTRFAPLIARLRHIVADGGIGEVRSISADLGFVAGPRAKDRIWDPALGGGALLDVGIYPVAFAQMLLGSPQKLASHGTLTADGVDAEAALLLGWAGGAYAQLETSLIAHSGNTARVVGTAGRIDVPARFHQPSRLIHTRSDGSVQVYEDEPVGRGYVPMLRAVHECVRHGRTQTEEMPLSDTISVMSILDDALRTLGVSYPAPAPAGL